MTDLTFLMSDGREEENKQTNKQTDRQTKFSWIFLEEARRFSTVISYVLN